MVKKCRNLLGPLNQFKAGSEILTCWVAGKMQSQALLGFSTLLQLPKKELGKESGEYGRQKRRDFPSSL